MIPCYSLVNIVVLLRIASEDGYVRIWKIPPQGIEEDMEEPFKKIQVHASKVVLFEFHPFAADILVTVSASLK